MPSPDLRIHVGVFSNQFAQVTAGLHVVTDTSINCFCFSCCARRLLVPSVASTCLCGVIAVFFVVRHSMLLYLYPDARLSCMAMRSFLTSIRTSQTKTEYNYTYGEWREGGVMWDLPFT